MFDTAELPSSVVAELIAHDNTETLFDFVEGLYEIDAYEADLD